jgi:DNA repair exonuclease SbcCD nuclease subunit
LDRNCTKWFKQELDSQGINDVIFCGDFFHYRDEISLISLDAANQFLDELNDKRIYMITGNHDCYYKETSEVNSLSIFKGRSNITVYDELTTIHINGKSVTFCPWGTQIKDIPKSDLLFGHFELQNFKMNAFKVCDTGDDPEILSNKSPLTFSGHFHSRDEKTFGDNKIIYVGNPFQMDFADANQYKGYYTLEFDTGEYKFIPNKKTPIHVKINLSKLIQLKDADKEFNDYLPNNIVKLVVDKNISTEHLDILTAKFFSYKPDDFSIDYDVNYNKIKVEQDVDHHLSGVSIENAIEEFVNMLDINNKKEVIDYTINLLQKAKL